MASISSSVPMDTRRWSCILGRSNRRTSTPRSRSPCWSTRPEWSGWAMNRKLELESWTWKPISRSLWVTHVRVAMILPRVSSKYAVSRTAASPAAWASRSRG